MSYVNDAKYTFGFSGGIHTGIHEIRSQRDKKRMKIVCELGERERKRTSDTNERDRNVLHVSKHLSVRFKFLDYACVELVRFAVFFVLFSTLALSHCCCSFYPLRFEVVNLY